MHRRKQKTEKFGKYDTDNKEKVPDNLVGILIRKLFCTRMLKLILLGPAIPEFN